MATQRQVKTDRLPYTRFVRGKYWYFEKGSLVCPLAGEEGDEAFLAHYNELCRISGVPGIAFEDKRKVYFMGWDGSPVKIGLADDVKARRDTLQVACPYDLKIHAVTDGGLKGELAYHRQFKNWHLRGEWFARCEQIEAEIARLQPSISRTRER